MSSTLHKGLVTRSPSASDASTKPPTSRSVDSSPTRSAPGRSNPPLGPRSTGM